MSQIIWIPTKKISIAGNHIPIGCESDFRFTQKEIQCLLRYFCNLVIIVFFMILFSIIILVFEDFEGILDILFDAAPVFA